MASVGARLLSKAVCLAFERPAVEQARQEVGVGNGLEFAQQDIALVLQPHFFDAVFLQHEDRVKQASDLKAVCSSWRNGCLELSIGDRHDDVRGFNKRLDEPPPEVHGRNQQKVENAQGADYACNQQHQRIITMSFDFVFRQIQYVVAKLHDGLHGRHILRGQFGSREFGTFRGALP